jgi:predicted ABC-type sugar transport system permease subunit
MNWSLVVAIAVVVVVIFWYLRSRRQESHHLDDIHITEDADRKETER